ncbi:hypothetical protein [Corallococcus sp. AS-1-6]|uniref:hypothetical protein n=1 Tax=Corallococcus sp. AS-1-6 TaxID=2874599 RepID=UPI001CBF2EB3|nr:hypothetical protein [Corallococcus sp. AS-1-6]MBZ4373217.1 hypothetical protein [Corallococcus sp. AS-1-6]
MDEIDRLHADDERRTKLRDAVKARLAGVEIGILSTLAEIEQIQQDMRSDLKDGRSSLYLENEQLMKRMMEHRDRLIAEHAVLEGLLDRPVARWVPRVALGVGLVSLAWQIIAALWHLK